ncbi:hypothetical protein MIND_00998200 [Mycena indigotica]|uniref:Uncharacterized protein n=1 Tax=Mycena indigotica TaxID=2126181 RepID=A0A8H6VWL8_9AGAR|nr:uncharacterized protein MIND_00998200 [Mycena indigotica]KAF7294616.1 hypothetical protein MIND_00998200 [Mycena indigotica]
MAATLEPIVIPPIVIEKFTCAGTGLRYDNQERVAPDVLRTLLLPSGARNGITDRERPKAWWSAQAVFYGLKHTKSMSIQQIRGQLEDALRSNKLAVTQELLDMEYQSNQEFRELNAQVREKTSGAGGGKRKHTEAKGKTSAVEGSPQKKQRVKATTTLDAPKKPRAKKATPTPAPTPMDVDFEDAKPVKQTAKKTGPSARQDMPHTFNPFGAGEPVRRTVQTARKSTGRAAPKRPVGVNAASSSQGMPRQTDATSGYWTITCPYITQEWDHEDFSFNIVSRGTTFECEFELGIIHGLMRSNRVEPRADGAYVTLEWAGKEEEGPVCCPTNGRTGFIKFTGPKLKGKLNSVPACGPDLAFEGQWVGPPTRIQATWDDYNQEAYERANRARWGRGGGWY